MDPNVCGKLLTTHRRGKDVDVEALRGCFALRQSAGKGLQDGISWIQKVTMVEIVFRGAPGCLLGT